LSIKLFALTFTRIRRVKVENIERFEQDFAQNDHDISALAQPVMTALGVTPKTRLK
jgi:hypothetical protein